MHACGADRWRSLGELEVSKPLSELTSVYARRVTHNSMLNLVLQQCARPVTLRCSKKGVGSRSWEGWFADMCALLSHSSTLLLPDHSSSVFRPQLPSPLPHTYAPSPLPPPRFGLPMLNASSIESSTLGRASAFTPLYALFVFRSLNLGLTCNLGLSISASISVSISS